MKMLLFQTKFVTLLANVALSINTYYHQVQLSKKARKHYVIFIWSGYYFYWGKLRCGIRQSYSSNTTYNKNRVLKYFVS